MGVCFAEATGWRVLGMSHRQPVGSLSRLLDDPLKKYKGKLRPAEQNH